MKKVLAAARKGGRAGAVPTEKSGPCRRCRCCEEDPCSAEEEQEAPQQAQASFLVLGGCKECGEESSQGARCSDREGCQEMGSCRDREVPPSYRRVLAPREAQPLHGSPHDSPYPRRGTHPPQEGGEEGRPQGQEGRQEGRQEGHREGRQSTQEGEEGGSQGCCQGQEGCWQGGSREALSAACVIIAV